MLIAACGDDGANADGEGTGPGITVGDPTVGDDSTGGGLDSTDDGVDGSTGAPECVLDTQCGDAEVCLEGSCCDATAVCGSSCCAAGDLCLFDACVVPGSTCTTADDCADGEYCELAFGDPGGGMGMPPGPGLACTQPLPPTGACLSEPQVCGDPGADPANCVEACEFVPQPGQLDATIKWQWGLVDAGEYPDHSDVWATPTVARLYDANCDGQIDLNDPPNLVFVAGNTGGTCCSCGPEAISTCRTGVLRVLDGRSGEEVWSLDKAQDGQYGFAGMSVALGDVDLDGYVDIVAMTGDGYLVVVDRNGQVTHVSDMPVPSSASNFGWGGGIAIGDMDRDGQPEMAYGSALFSIVGGQLTLLWTGANGNGGGQGQSLSYFVDLDGGGDQELLAGNTAYLTDGSVLWTAAGIGDGFTATGDLDGDGTPEVVLVRNSIWALDGASGTVELGPVGIPGGYQGGPPTIADFDGDGAPEVGVAGGAAYVAYAPNFATGTFDELWQHTTKDTSSARTGSSLFDFEGDGRAEVVYSDECFLRVLDGETGTLRFAAPNTTFTATEALIVADVDGDAHAEIVRVSNSANWDCDQPPWTDGDLLTGLPAWEPPAGAAFYQGLTVFGDAQNSWVGTRKMWNQHAYHVSNVCDGRDSACDPGMGYGEIPANARDNWSLAWLNNFRQNVQDEGIFDAPDVTVSLDVDCGTPPLAHVAVRNAGLAPLPAGVEAEVVATDDGSVLGSVVTTQALLPGQTEILDLTTPAGTEPTAEMYARIVIDPLAAAFIECRDDNNESAPAHAFCGPG
jgi:hypothetical protein